MSNNEDDEDQAPFPNRLLGQEIFTLDNKQQIAILVFETDAFDGWITINRQGAKQLRAALDLFLDGRAPPLPTGTEH